MNIFPLLLVGGVAALAVSQSRKKDEKKCPPTTVVTLGEMRSVADRSSSKNGSDPDPSGEANHFINEILPPACNRGSINSRVKIQVQGIEKGFEMTIPDLYMLTFAQCLSLRVDRGKISSKEAGEFWSRELDWYKKTTGSNFDANLAGLAALAKIILEIFRDSAEDEPDQKPPKMGGCPKSINLDMMQAAELIQGLVNSEIASGNRDPFKMADMVISSLAPQGCSKSDYGTVVTLTAKDPGITMPPVDLAAFYGSLAWQIGKMLLELSMIGPPKLDVIKSKILGDYMKLTGKSFPQELE